MIHTLKKSDPFGCKLIKAANQLNAIDAARLIASGDLTCEQLARACMHRIIERNDLTHALVAFTESDAMEKAEDLDQSHVRGYLHGLPFVAKDMFDSADFPTEYGSEIYAGYQPRTDSASILRFKRDGAILLGKAATSEFATRKPSQTRNPLRLTHTPGGSSSGSAAAVADFMVPFALGTQSTGSIARPASYCGIVGFKPTFDFFNRAGLKATSQSMDTVGLLTRTVSDAAFIAFNDMQFVDRVARAPMPKFSICNSTQWQFVDVHFRRSIEQLSAGLREAGYPTVETRLDQPLEELIQIQEKIFIYEARDALAAEFLGHPELISDALQNRLADSACINQDTYLDFRRRVELSRASVEALFNGSDILIYPATESSAELGIDYSGSPRFGALWTLLHLPSVVVPFAYTPNGMPFGVQLIARFGDDRKLLSAAEKLSQYLDMTGRNAA